jgi:hypothetical protein
MSARIKGEDTSCGENLPNLRGNQSEGKPRRPGSMVKDKQRAAGSRRSEVHMENRRRGLVEGMER